MNNLFTRLFEASFQRVWQFFAVLLVARMRAESTRILVEQQERLFDQARQMEESYGERDVAEAIRRRARVLGEFSDPVSDLDDAVQRLLLVTPDGHPAPTLADPANNGADIPELRPDEPTRRGPDRPRRPSRKVVSRVQNIPPAAPGA